MSKHTVNIGLFRSYSYIASYSSNKTGVLDPNLFLHSRFSSALSFITFYSPKLSLRVSSTSCGIFVYTESSVTTILYGPILYSIKVEGVFPILLQEPGNYTNPSRVWMYCPLTPIAGDDNTIIMLMSDQLTLFLDVDFPSTVFP